jgi:regulator of cell morphogenesis and NO signaling
MEHMEGATVAELAVTSLAAVRVFEKYGIDYCCGGKRPLEDACLRNGQNVQVVQQELEAALQSKPAPEYDWNNAPLHALIEHIVAVHHEYLRRELPAIQARLDKVYRVYNQRYGPTLEGLPEVFAELRDELEPHMQKEEAILFPAIRAIEWATNLGTALPRMPFGNIANPIRMMEAEHDHAGSALQRIREITGNFEVPAYACVTYKALMSGLAELEADLHMHIHLENNVLFRRADQLENALAVAGKN